MYRPNLKLPSLRYEEWKDTRETLHRWIQIVGKVRMALHPFRNHWWHVPLYVSPVGLGTRVLPVPGAEHPDVFEMGFDFVNHRFVITTSRGEVRSFDLPGLSVQSFHSHLNAELRRIGVEVSIREEPFGIGPKPHLNRDRQHHSYDPGAVTRFREILAFSNYALEAFCSGFRGKVSPVHFFWHSFDIAMTRFSGRAAPERHDADIVTQEAYSDELISFGWWPGDERYPGPAFYSYTYPEPEGIREFALHPGEVAFWRETERGSLALFPYEDVCERDAPFDDVLAFFQSAYEAGADLANWNREMLERPSPAIHGRPEIRQDSNLPNLTGAIDESAAG